jgi:hypothetical protein
MLQGYREVRPAEPFTTEASILWRRLQLVLSLLPRGAAPGLAWAERPIARLTDMLLYFDHLTDPPWRELGQPHGAEWQITGRPATAPERASLTRG